MLLSCTRMSKFGDTIKFIRVKSGMSRQELSDASGLAPNHIARLEVRYEYSPSIKTIVRLAHALECTPEALAKAAIEDLEGGK